MARELHYDPATAATLWRDLRNNPANTGIRSGCLARALLA